jgi:hypothetical protein
LSQQYRKNRPAMERQAVWRADFHHNCSSEVDQQVSNDLA